MAEEDLIFGKNRHMFGGIEPSNMKRFTVLPASGGIRITAQLPDDTTLDGQQLCTVGGAVIRRKTTGYPVDEFDGDFVANITESGTILDSTADASVPQYYAAFPYSTQDVYNRGHKNRAIYDYPEASYYFGYDLDLTNDNSSDRVTYPDDVMNAEYTPAKMNFTSKAFEYGGWPSTAGEKFMPKPCILNADGTVDAYLNPNDYTKKVDGTASNIASAGAMSAMKKNAMMEWPKIYVYREVVNGIYKFRCSDKKVGSDWDCWSNYDVNNNEIDHFYTAIYGSVNSYSNTTWPCSRSGEKTVYGHSSSPYYLYQSPKKLSSDWDVEVLADRLLIQDLLVMMAKTTNCQAAYGNGCVGASRVAPNGKETDTYNTDTAGLFYGYNTSDTYPVKVFGMENFWGNVPRLLTGFVINLDEIKVKLTSGTHDGTTTNGYNETGIGYITIAKLSDYMSTSGSYGGYISGTINQPYGRIPILKDGSATQYEADTLSYFRATSGAAKYAVTGCHSYNDGNAAGPFYIYAVNGTSDSSTTGAIYLSCKPRRSTS